MYEEHHRIMKECFWKLVGSVQNPVENPCQKEISYGANIAHPDGTKTARLTLTFEDKK